MFIYSSIFPMFSTKYLIHTFTRKQQECWYWLPLQHNMMTILLLCSKTALLLGSLHWVNVLTDETKVCWQLYIMNMYSFKCSKDLISINLWAYSRYRQYDYNGRAFPFTAKLGNKLGIQFTECCISNYGLIYNQTHA